MKVTPLKKCINYTLLAIVSWNLFFLFFLSFRAEAADQMSVKAKGQNEAVQHQAVKRLQNYRGTKSWMMGKLFRVQQQLFNNGRLSLYELNDTKPVILNQRRYFNEPAINLNMQRSLWAYNKQWNTYFYAGRCGYPGLGDRNEGIFIIAVPFNNGQMLLTPWWPKFGGYDRIDRCYE